MPRTKKTPPTPETAAEGGTPNATDAPKQKAFHPMFPALDMRSISSLWVYRLVTARGTRRAEVPEMLDGPLDPGAITSDAMLRNYGPGVIRLVARSHNGGIIGHPITMRFPDERGHVPVLPEEFGSGAAEGASAPVQADPLRRELDLLKERMADERAAFKEMLAEERAQGRANVESITGLMDKILDAQKAMSTPAPSAELAAPARDPYFRQELQRVSRELEKAQKELAERKEAFFKLQTKKEGATEEFSLEKLTMVANFMKEFFRDGVGGGGGGGSAPGAPAPPAVPEGFVVIAGEAIPPLAMLDEVIKAEKGDVRAALTDEGLATFKRLHAKGMLPRTYEERLKSVLDPVG